MKPARTPLKPAKAPVRRTAAVLSVARGGATDRLKTTGVASRSGSGGAKSSSRLAKAQPLRALKVTVEVDPLVDVVRRHVHLTPTLAKVIKGDFLRLFRTPALDSAPTTSKVEPTAKADPILSTQEAADLVGVSRPYIVARIEAGDLPLHQQVGNQRRVLKSAVLAWHRREQVRRRRALGQLGEELDNEVFAS